MREKKIRIIQQPLTGMDGFFDLEQDGEKIRKNLRLMIEGVGESATAQFVDLIKRMGLERAYEKCKENKIWGVAKDSQLLVDCELKTRSKYVTKQVEGDKAYYIFINTDTATKRKQLDALSCTAVGSDPIGTHRNDN